ncbi:MAG: phosphoribosylanthranilate isomerase [Acidobacteriia bacterium]|nr:phosphoribosylanthranilate isomerase [Terriglobia bacterium]
MSEPFILKICGITNEEDARVSIESGANALGFNFCPASPRFVSPRRARDIAAAVPGDYLTVGVFVDASEPELRETAAQAQLDIIQLHGNCALPASLRVWRAIAASDGAGNPDPRIEAWLLDSAPHGGSGQTFDWKLAARFPRAILAGGLDASNVAQAIGIASPWGVDACSRLESSPGKKDPQKVRAFAQAALAALHQATT